MSKPKPRLHKHAHPKGVQTHLAHITHNNHVFNCTLHRKSHKKYGKKFNPTKVKTDRWYGSTCYNEYRTCSCSLTAENVQWIMRRYSTGNGMLRFRKLETTIQQYIFNNSTRTTKSKQKWLNKFHDVNTWTHNTSHTFLNAAISARQVHWKGDTRKTRWTQTTQVDAAMLIMHAELLGLRQLSRPVWGI